MAQHLKELIKTKKFLVIVPAKQFEEIKKLIDQGYYATFSDFVRDAIREKLKQFGR